MKKLFTILLLATLEVGGFVYASYVAYQNGVDTGQTRGDFAVKQSSIACLEIGFNAGCDQRL